MSAQEGFEFTTRSSTIVNAPYQVQAQLFDERDRQLEDFIGQVLGRGRPVARVPARSLFGPATGDEVENGGLNATPHTTSAGAADRLELAPMVLPIDLTFDRIAARCNTGVAAANVKLLAYDSGVTGWPATLLKETASLSAATSSTTQEEAWSYRFLAGRVYWVGIRHSSTATMRAVSVAATPSLGIASIAGSDHFTVLRRTLTFATAAPTTWVYDAADRTLGIAPTAIRFRAAS